MPFIDLAVVAMYIAGVIWLGARCLRRQRGIRDYFLTGRRVPWWAVAGSIVATETSTVTLISIPGYAFGADLTFLQLALGYLAARVVVAVVLLPLFFRGDLLSAYQLVTSRFGTAAGRATAGLFLATRSLADGFRLFATGLVLAAMLSMTPLAGRLGDFVPPPADPAVALLVVSIGLIALVTLLYTLLGGMLAVIWTDVIQLVVYVGGALAAGLILLGDIPGGWHEVASRAGAAGKLRLFDFAADLSRSYTFWAGLVGGGFLTAATHGADQMFVQRYLCSRSLADARRALIASGFAILVQFALFLILGLMLWTYYTAHAPDALAAITAAGEVQTDRVFPVFMATHLPAGLRGLLLAAILAAAMSTLSSSLNASAASTLGDFYLPLSGRSRSERHYLQAARWATVGWCIVQVIVALAAIALSRSVVDEVLGIQSFTGGLILGCACLCLFRVRETAAAPLAGMACGGAVLIAVRLTTSVSWQWYALIGALVTVAAGMATAHAAGRAAAGRETA
ncbi:MAG: sodium:solute symporter [Acidobacteria bacterium]|nr:sodium:solute symporter [Acidobacteriota bacterium]